MARVVVTIDIAAPPEAVWELLSDPRRFPEFVDATHLMIDVPEEEFGAGYTYTEYGGVRPFFGEATWKVVEFEPPFHQLHQGDDGKMSIDLFVDLERREGGTRLTHTVMMRPRWYMAPLNAILWPLLMKKRTYASMEKTNENVKRIVEESFAKQHAKSA